MSLENNREGFYTVEKCQSPSLGSTPLRPLALVMCALMATACSSVSTVQPEPLELTELEASANAHAVTQEPPVELADVNWWQQFSAPQLNRLVEQGLRENYSLQAAWERLSASRAVAEQQASGRYPTLNITAGRSRSWTESATASSTSDNWSAGLSTEYELDFWGRVSALDKQGELSALSTEAAGRVQANTTANGIVQAWYGWVYQQRLMDLLLQQQRRVENSLKATESRFRRGLAVRSDVWQQQQLLESLTSEINESRRQQQLQGQQLAVWSGQSRWLASAGVDGEALVALQSSVFPDIAEVPEVPLAALKERPDVQQAWYDLQADNAAVAAAVANRYPRLTLSASYSGSAPQWDDVFDNWVANLAGNLVLPLLDGGNRKATVLQREAQVREAVASYQQALLNAVQEVRAAQTNEAAVLREISSLETRLDLARKTEASQQVRYLRGVVDLLQLITAQRSVLTLEQQLLAARWQQLQYRIQLFKAVSHGHFDSVAASSQTSETESSQVLSPSLSAQKGDQA